MECNSELNLDINDSEIENDSDIDIDEESDNKSSFRLITITMECKLLIGLNPTIIFNYISLDDKIIGIKFENNIKGQMTCIKTNDNNITVKKHRNKVSTKKKIPLPKKYSHGDFRHQITMNIITDDKSINTKIFSNGTIIFTGCKKIIQSEIAKDILLKKLIGLTGEYKYPIEIPICRSTHDARRIYKNKILKWIPLMRNLQYWLNVPIPDFFKIIDMDFKEYSNSKYNSENFNNTSTYMSEIDKDFLNFSNNNSNLIVNINNNKKPI